VRTHRNVGLADLVERLAFLDKVDSRGRCNGFGSIRRVGLRVAEETYGIAIRRLGFIEHHIVDGELS
jgi:hypothetical protein